MPKPPDYHGDEFEGWTDKQLVTHVTSNAGAPGAGAAAELTRRLADATRSLVPELQESTRIARKLVRLTWALIVLTVALGLVALVQVLKSP